MRFLIPRIRLIAVTTVLVVQVQVFTLGVSFCFEQIRTLQVRGTFKDMAFSVGVKEKVEFVPVVLLCHFNYYMDCTKSKRQIAQIKHCNRL